MTENKHKITVNVSTYELFVKTCQSTSDDVSRKNKQSVCSIPSTEFEHVLQLVSFEC